MESVGNVEVEVMEVVDESLIAGPGPFSRLPVEVIGKILSHLDFIDLIKMWDVNKKLREVIVNDKRLYHVLNRKLGAINIDGHDRSRYKHVNKRGGYLAIEGARSILRYMRIFNKNIEVVFINFKNCRIFMQQAVLLQLFKYCRVKLSYLALKNLSCPVIYEDPPIFENVTHLDFHSCYVSPSFCKLPMFFPHVRILNFLKRNEFHEPKQVVQTYKHLQIMKVSPLSLNRSWYTILGIYNYRTFFRYVD